MQVRAPVTMAYVVPGGGTLRKLDTRDQAISYKRSYSRRSKQACQVPVRVAARLVLLTRRASSQGGMRRDRWRGRPRSMSPRSTNTSSGPFTITSVTVAKDPSGPRRFIRGSNEPARSPSET